MHCSNNSIGTFIFLSHFTKQRSFKVIHSWWRKERIQCPFANFYWLLFSLWMTKMSSESIHQCCCRKRIEKKIDLKKWPIPTSLLSLEDKPKKNSTEMWWFIRRPIKIIVFETVCSVHSTFCNGNMEWEEHLLPNVCARMSIKIDRCRRWAIDTWSGGNKSAREFVSPVVSDGEWSGGRKRLCIQND